MRSRHVLAALALAALSLSVYAAATGGSRNPLDWEIHDMNRPMSPVVEPGTFSEGCKPPSDAVVLFDGTNTDKWDGKWEIKDGALVVVPKSGDMRTKDAFGDCQLHIEWSSDPSSKGTSQSRSNSGVFLMDTYEVQVLDTYRNENKTYADGQAGSIYGQYPPLVNPARPAGEWNAYDIIFHRPHFDDAGKVTQPATMTVFFNGCLVQDHEALVGPTSHAKRQPYAKHADKLPIHLQDHRNDPIRYRNIWIRPLE
ncbi:MAG: DUF1080 domain-containing protein [Planctomycetes bacterium]|nr:DUF1080 domain-containing protein [Planctomycetota bacterium]